MKIQRTKYLTFNEFTILVKDDLVLAKNLIKNKYILTFHDDHETDSAKEKVLIWGDKNCTGYFMITDQDTAYNKIYSSYGSSVDKIIYFQNEEDAVAFKLQFAE